MTDTKEKKQLNGLGLEDLRYGEAYRTTKKYIWSNYDDQMARITVPANELLIFRSSEPYKGNTELALFVWLKERTTVCLSAEMDRSILFVKHMDWEKRHEKLKLVKRTNKNKKTVVEEKIETMLEENSWILAFEGFTSVSFGVPTIGKIDDELGLVVSVSKEDRIAPLKKLFKKHLNSSTRWEEYPIYFTVMDLGKHKKGSENDKT